MDWDALGDYDDDEDRFFETCDRLSSAVPLDLASSGSDDENEFEDTRLSFASAISSVSTTEFRNYAVAAAAVISPDYDIWMAAPGSIKERRKRLLQGMGLAADKELLRISSKDLTRAVSTKIVNGHAPPDINSDPGGDTKQEPSPSPLPVVLVRSRRIKPGGKNSSSSGWIKVKQTGKSYKELSALHLCQAIHAHQGSIWTMKFSPDTRFLASGGEDRTIQIWEVQECEIMSLNEGCLTPLQSFSTPGLGEVTPMPSVKKKKKGSSNKKAVPFRNMSMYRKLCFRCQRNRSALSPVILMMSWTCPGPDHRKFHGFAAITSSSMDKTVRLWDMETKSCLKMFAHNDYVTCVHFNPMDDNYFISGSLDNKVRIWSIPDRQLVDWTDLHEMVTAVCYTPDGQGAFTGSHTGSCRMYNVEDSKLSQAEQIDLQNKKRPRKITGFQFSPGNPSEVLVASADSRIRILDGSELVHKFRGFRNLNSQIAASFSTDGKYIICASEDSHVDVSIAIPWPGTVKGDPPPVQVHSKRHSKRSSNSQTPSSFGSPTKDDASVSSKRDFPSSVDSPTGEDNFAATNSKRQLPPLPKKNNNNNNVDRAPSMEEHSYAISRSDSGLGDSFSSSVSSSIRYGDSPSISATPSPSSSRSSSWSWVDGSHGNQTVRATAWGMVIVTATLGGEIRAYQNFGLPRRIGRQSNLF
ncbi:hypothetical protein GH714_010523 [Hevea brasiliensis]|uniref:Anaphase-promoting complex subunit 4 WD40 domain-containing protein n=1 Tax=Hevea brasiliensis TaxID=3981 RepID=A0A6A6KMN5_HEVBR|nr:hypothetical protein GH714_010523 [Hevea brasiliensis]